MVRPTNTNNVHQHDDLLWRAKPGATTSFEELVVARELWTGVHRDARWNPWVTEDRATELSQAMAVMNQWTRAEPNFRQWTADETDAWMEQLGLEQDALRAKEEARWEAAKKDFDAEKFAARRALLEQESIVSHLRHELALYRSGTRYPGMPEQKRTGEIADLTVKLAHGEREAGRLRGVVVDPETIVSADGQLPSDRRTTMLLYFSISRQAEVRRLRKEVPELQTAAKNAIDKNERKKLRAHLSAASGELEYQLGIQPVNADEMCSECPTPLSDHGWVSIGPHEARPCSAWPGWAARIEQARKILRESVTRNSEQNAEPSVPKQQPIAVLASGLPLGDVISQLTVLQKKHPNAVVKRGRANRWEIWRE